jgi:hypothetical protein
MDQLVFEKFEKPVAESKYIVRVKSKQKNWRNFLYIATNEGTVILPSHVLKNVNGAAYQRDYNFKLLPGTGPFTLSEADVVKGKSCPFGGAMITGARRDAAMWDAAISMNCGFSSCATKTSPSKC